MASSRDTAAFIREQIEGAGAVATRAMFGEYALYLDGKVIALICDDTLYLKDIPAGRALFPEAGTGAPYPGARPHLIADPLLDDPERLCAVARAICDALPAPKPQKPRKPKGREPSCEAP